MAVIQMPSRGKKEETGMITKWYKKTGDWVAEGDELFSFDTDDGSYTVKSQKAGRLVAIFVPEGELVHCPTDVGMLSSPSPESVLHLGRMQFVDEEKPRVAPHADPEPIAPEAEESPLAEAAPEAEPAPEAEAAPLAEPAPEAEEAPLAEAAPLAEPTPEAEEAPEELGDAEPQADEAPAELDSSAQEGAEGTAPEEDAQPAEAEPEEEAPGIALSFADMEPEEADEEEARAAGAEAAEDGAPESEAQEETAEEALHEQEPEQTEPEAAAAEPARPASLTRRVDVALCQDIAARTGVTLAAMVRFAALRSAPAGLLAPLEDETLRGMSAQQDLPNVLDLGKWGVVRAQRTGAGELCFLVPAAAETARRKGEAVEWVPTLELTLCFDEA